MVLDTKEQIGSRPAQVTSSGTATERIYYAYGENDPDAILAELPAIGTSHPTISGTYLVSNSVKQLRNVANVLEIKETYAPPNTGNSNQTNVNSEVWQYDMNARSKQITSVEEASNQTIYNKDDPSGAATNYETGIGVEGDNVKGVNVYRPAGALRITKYFNAAVVDQAFRQGLYAQQNTLNDDAWQDWSAQEVLFLGSRIKTNVTTQLSAVSYSFLFGTTRTGVTADVWNNDISFQTTPVTLGTVYPFQVTWFKYGKRFLPDSSSTPTKGSKKQYIIDAFKSNVYKQSDFDALGIVGNP